VNDSTILSGRLTDRHLRWSPPTPVLQDL